MVQAAQQGIRQLRVSDTPIAVVDTETTGLSAHGDRVIEIGIVLVEPGKSPRIVLDTLVNPERPVSATEIHGITDDDVRDAPTFRDIADHVQHALHGCVFASYNVYFDAKFIAAELNRCGIKSFPPHVCLMYLRPGLDIGPRCTLREACRIHGIPHTNAHRASDDALVSSLLWGTYNQRMASLQIGTYSDLANRLSYKFLESFDNNPLSFGSAPGSARLKARPKVVSLSPETPSATTQQRLAEYWEALKIVISDLVVTDEELRHLAIRRDQLGLTPTQVRSLHARVFAGLLADAACDHAIDEPEAERIARLADCLSSLGWRPGDRVGPLRLPNSM